MQPNGVKKNTKTTADIKLVLRQTTVTPYVFFSLITVTRQFWFHCARQIFLGLANWKWNAVHITVWYSSSLREKRIFKIQIRIPCLVPANRLRASRIHCIFVADWASRICYQKTSRPDWTYHFSYWLPFSNRFQQHSSLQNNINVTIS